MMLSKSLAVLGLVAGLSGLPSPASAQKALVLTGIGYSSTGWYTGVSKSLTDSGLFPDGVDHLDGYYSDPLLMDLVKYRLIVVLADDYYGFRNATGVGDPLGDYMAMVSSGSVLLFQPNAWTSSTRGVGGKFLANYSLTSMGSASYGYYIGLGTVTANDPIAAGVPAFSCGYYCNRATGQSVLPGATVSAYWSDGRILAVRGKRRVDLNMMPADETVLSGGWPSAARTLITNAINFLGASATATPNKASFGNTVLGAKSTTTTITFRNVAGTTIQVNGLGLEGTGKDQFVFQSSKNPTATNPYTMPADGTLTVDVNFRPQKQGSYTAKLYLGLVGLSTVRVPLDGSSIGDLYVSLSPVDFGGLATGTSSTLSVFVQNMGAGIIDVNQPSIIDTTHFTLTPALPDLKVSMFPGATYFFDVQFSPGTDTGVFSTNISLTSTDPTSPMTIPVKSMAGEPKGQISYTAIALPNVPVGEKGLPLEIPVSNTGYSDLLINEISADKSDFEVPNAPSAMSPFKVPAQQTQSFQLVFAPKMAGLRTATLTVKSNETPAPGMPDSNKTIQLSATGTTPQFKVSATTVDFGTTTIGAGPIIQSIDLINSGNGDLTVKEVAILAGPTADSFSVSTMDVVPFLLHAGATVTVPLTFNPKAAGMLVADLRVVTSLATSGTAMIALKGQANGSIASISDMNLDFGIQRVLKKTSKTLVISNKGNLDFTISKSTLSPLTGAFTATLPADGTKVGAGKSIVIGVDATPAAVGASTGTLEIQTTDTAVAGGTKFSVPLSVSGQLESVSVSATSLSFPPVLVGQRSTMQTFTVTNTGTVTIDNLAAAVSGSTMGTGNDSSSFWISPGYKTTLAPGESSDIGVIFEPTVAKNQLYATAVMSMDGTMVMMVVNLSGSSISAVLLAQPSLLSFENTTVGQTSLPRTFTLTNDGMSAIDIEIVPPPGEDFVLDMSQTSMSLGPGLTTPLLVTFAPKSAGFKDEMIGVRLKGGKASIVDLEVTGKALGEVTMMPQSNNSGLSCHVTSGRSGTASAFPLLLLAALAGLLLLRRRRIG